MALRAHNQLLLWVSGTTELAISFDERQPPPASCRRWRILDWMIAEGRSYTCGLRTGVASRLRRSPSTRSRRRWPRDARLGIRLRASLHQVADSSRV